MIYEPSNSRSIFRWDDLEDQFSRHSMSEYRFLYDLDLTYKGRKREKRLTHNFCVRFVTPPPSRETKYTLRADRYDGQSTIFGDWLLTRFRNMPQSDEVVRYSIIYYNRKPQKIGSDAVTNKMCLELEDMS